MKFNSFHPVVLKNQQKNQWSMANISIYDSTFVHKAAHGRIHSSKSPGRWLSRMLGPGTFNGPLRQQNHEYCSKNWNEDLKIIINHIFSPSVKVQNPTCLTLLRISWHLFFAIINTTAASHVKWTAKTIAEIHGRWPWQIKLKAVLCGDVDRVPVWTWKRKWWQFECLPNLQKRDFPQLVNHEIQALNMCKNTNEESLRPAPDVPSQRWSCIEWRHCSYFIFSKLMGRIQFFNVDGIVPMAVICSPRVQLCNCQFFFQCRKRTRSTCQHRMFPCRVLKSCSYFFATLMPQKNNKNEISNTMRHKKTRAHWCIIVWKCFVHLTHQHKIPNLAKHPKTAI